MVTVTVTVTVTVSVQGACKQQKAKSMVQQYYHRNLTSPARPLFVSPSLRRPDPIRLDPF